MTIWRDDDPGSRYTLIPRDLIEQGPVKAFASALLEQWQETEREGKQLDLRSALRRLRDQHHGPEELMDAYSRNLQRYDEAREEYERVLAKHNKVVDSLNRLRRRAHLDGFLPKRAAEEKRELEADLPRVKDELREAGDHLDQAIGKVASLGEKIRAKLVAVTVEGGSPNLRQPEDPRRTDSRVKSLDYLPTSDQRKEEATA